MQCAEGQRLQNVAGPISSEDKEPVTACRVQRVLAARCDQGEVIIVGTQFLKTDSKSIQCAARLLPSLLPL